MHRQEQKQCLLSKTVIELMYWIFGGSVNGELSASSMRYRSARRYTLNESTGMLKLTRHASQSLVNTTLEWHPSDTHRYGSCM